MVKDVSEVDRMYYELDEFEIRMLQEKRMMSGSGSAPPQMTGLLKK